MGEARRRGTLDQRVAGVRGKPSRWRDIWPLKPAKVVKRHSTVSKRERSKRKRGVKRVYGLKRWVLGAIGAGHMASPEGYDMAMYRARVGGA